MKKFLLTFSVVAVFTAAFFVNYKYAALAANQSEGAIPTTGDLCSGTGGKGEIVGLGNNSFTIRRNDDGRTQTIYLASQAAIKTSAGSVSLSNLKTGESVTLVGGPDSDGSFTADTVVICTTNAKGAPPTVNGEKTKNFNTAVALAKFLLFGLIWLGIVIYLAFKKKMSSVYLLFFTIFYVYLYFVLDYTLFQFQSLVFERYFISGLMLNGVKAGKGLNLIPLATLTLKDARTSLLNILMMMPFGFGLPFVTKLRFKKVVIIGAAFSIAIEFLQFITGFVGKMTFRIADINDVIFNTIGVIIGYVLFAAFVRIFSRVFNNSKTSSNPIFRYIARRPQIDKVQ